MKKFTQLLLVFAMTFGLSVTAQQQESGGKLEYVGTPASVTISPSISSRSQLIPAEGFTGKEPKDGRSVRATRSNVVPNKDPQTQDDFYTLNPGKLDKAIPSRALENDFIVNNNVGSPSDPAIAVGPNHSFIVYNTGFIIYDKNGNDLTGALNPTNIFPASNPAASGGPLCCDLTITYDNGADRWVATALYLNSAQDRGEGIILAVSQGPDPINTDWFLYALPEFDDYNKLSVFGDGYYATDNGPFDVWAIDRTAALAGDANTSIQGFTVNGIESPNGGFTSPQVANVTNGNMPTSGGAPLVYMRDDGFQGVTEDEVWIWTVNADFANPANSNVTAPEEFPVTEFINVFDGGLFNNLTQPGGGSDVDAIQSTIMNQTQFRKFPSYNSMIFNFVVDTDASGGELAGIRWYEFRQATDGGAWSMFQEGTFNAPNGKHAWMGSMAMDSQGNIALGYTAMAGPGTPNPTDFPIGAYYTGRFASDASGVMSIQETEIGIGNGNVNGIRFGDYAKMDVDPNNDKEFWFITENAQENIVGVFQIAPDFANDLGVVAATAPVDGILTDSEEITVTIFNFGENDATGFDVTYQIDGGATVTETFTGTVPSADSMDFTFAATADLSTVGQTYAIVACTALVGDEDTANDCFTGEVTNLEPNDVGVSAITAPSSASGLTATESVTITIQNFGGTTQTSIPVYFDLDGAGAVQETYSGSIESGMSDTYTFTATVDLSELGDYVLEAGTELGGDADLNNDKITVDISNFICQPESDCASDGDGVTQITLADQSITTECDGTSTGYSDNTDVIFNFVLEDNPFEGTLQVGFANNEYAMWIDFNDDNEFAADELVSTALVATAATDFAFTIDFNDFPNVANGMHRMRVKAEFQATAGDATDPCGDQSFGRTNDYTANISGMLLSTEDSEFGSTDLLVNYLPNDQFEVVFNNTSSFGQRLPISVINTLGQTLAYYTVENNGSGYSKTIDMSYVSSGVYFIKVGDETLNKVKKIVVN